MEDLPGGVALAPLGAMSEVLGSKIRLKQGASGFFDSVGTHPRRMNVREATGEEARVLSKD